MEMLKLHNIIEKYNVENHIKVLSNVKAMPKDIVGNVLVFRMN